MNELGTFGAKFDGKQQIIFKSTGGLSMKRIVIVLCAVATLGNFAVAAENASKPAGAKSPPEVTTEQRQKMAGLHEKMATCLRSDRPMSECRQEMMKGCKDTMGKDGCPMMGGKMGHGMHQHMMDEQSGGKE